MASGYVSDLASSANGQYFGGARRNQTLTLLCSSVITQQWTKGQIRERLTRLRKTKLR
jgi:hypothetical protein